MIPLKYLLHIVDIQKPIAGEHGRYTDAVQVDSVRLDSNIGIKNTDAGGKSGKAVLFINTSNLNISEIVLGAVVNWNGKKFTVSDIEYLYDAKILHHLEVILV